jgi:hypothetical protein
MVPSLRQYEVKKHRQANSPCYLIFDQQYVNGFSSFARRVATKFLKNVWKPTPVTNLTSIHALGCSRKLAFKNSHGSVATSRPFERNRNLHIDTRGRLRMDSW